MSLNALGLGFMFTATDLASGVMRNVKQNFQGLENAAGKSAGNIDQMAQKMGAGLTVAFAGVGGLAVSGKLAKQAGDLEQAMAAVKIVTHGNADEMKRLKDFALDAAPALAATPMEAAAGMEIMGQQGFKTEDILHRMPSMLKLSAAGHLSLNDAIDLSAQAMRAFNIQESMLPYALDQIVGAADAASMEVVDLQQGLARGSAGAKLFGATLTDTLVVFSAMKDVLHSTEMSGTATSLMFERLANPMHRAGLEAKGIQIVDKVTGQFRDITDIITDMIPVLDNMSGPDRAALLEKAFGSHAVKGIVGMLNRMKSGVVGTDGVMRHNAEAFTHWVSDIAAQNGTLERASKIALDTYNKALDTLSARSASFFTKLGEPFMVILRPVVETLSHWLDNLGLALDGISPTIKQVAAGIFIAASAAAVVMGALAAGTVIFGLFSIASTLAGIALSAMGAAAAGSLVALWPFVLAGVAIAAVVWAIKHNVGGLGDTWDRISAAFSKGADAIGGAFEYIGNYLSTIWDEMKVGFGEVWDEFSPVFGELSNAFTALFDALGKIGAQFGSVSSGPGSAMIGFARMLGGLISLVVMTMVALIDAFVRFASVVATVIGVVLSVVKPVFVWIGETIGGWLDKIARFFGVVSKVHKFFAGDATPAKAKPQPGVPVVAVQGGLDEKPTPAGPASVKTPPPPPAAAATAANTPFSGVQPPESQMHGISQIDYDKLAKAMSSRPINLTMDGQKLLGIIARANANNDAALGR